MVEESWQLLSSSSQALVSSTFYHWKAEQLPLRIRGVFQSNLFIALNNMTKNVNWTSIDRWNYNSSDHTKPQPPHYSRYTWLSLGNTFLAFLILMALQFFVIASVKIITLKTKKKSIFNFLVHIIENINIPFPYKDWDTEKLTVAEIKQKLREVNIEMAWTYVANFVFNILMFCPFWWTGIDAQSLFIFYAIFSVHKFLRGTSS